MGNSSVAKEYGSKNYFLQEVVYLSRIKMQKSILGKATSILSLSFGVVSGNCMELYISHIVSVYQTLPFRKGL